MKQFQAKNSSTPKTVFICRTAASKDGQTTQLVCQLVDTTKVSQTIAQKSSHQISVSARRLVKTQPNTPDPSCQNYQQIYDDFWPDATGAIEHQFEWQEIASVAKVLEVEREFFIPLDTVVPGTELVPGASVYGYNDDGSLDLTGGKAKSYNINYKGMELRYHGALEAKYYPNIVQPLSFMTPNTVKEYFDRVVSYFTARGYNMPAPDNFKQFSNQYVWSLPAGQNQFLNLSNAFIAMRFIYEKCDKLPKYVDLHASANPNIDNEYVVLDTYQPDPLLQENGHGYPLRITITKDSAEFNQLKNTQPIAYFDCKCKVLTIHVPENAEGYFYTHRITSGTGFLDFEYTEYLTAFDGSFSLLNKTCVNGLKCANFCKLDVLAQVSESVLVKSRAITDGSEQLFESTIPIRSAILGPSNPTVYYTGVVAPKMNGSSSSFDFYALPISINTSYTVGLDPQQYPSSEYFDQHYDEGDNPVTKVVEKYGVSASITGFDNNGWTQTNFSLPYEVITATASYPENLTTTPAPSTLSSSEAYKPVIMHEFTHTAQYESGINNYLPYEAMAVSIEMDTRAVGNLFSTVRARFFAQIHLRLTRGDFTMMRPDIEGRATYGMGMFWKYVGDQFDSNRQVQRRTGDILTSENLGPFLQSNSIPDLYATFPINRTGASAALRDSLQQLFGRNIKDLWNDFSIAIVLMRNNTSIPSQYQVGFPYWIYGSQYAGYSVIQTSLTFLGTPQYANWWEKLDTNQIVPANYGVSIATGQTFIRTLPQNFTTKLKNLTTVSFTVPNNLNTVTVNITAGEWRITLLQFTSDGTPVGSFIIDGPHAILGAGSHVFNISTHVPTFTANGSIRLVCANVTFSGTGTNMSDYFTTEAPTGTISILSA